MRVRLPPKALVCDAGKRPSLQNGPRGPSPRNLKVPCFSLLCEQEVRALGRELCQMGTNMEWKFSEERPLRVVTLCSGYDSQLMAIRNLGIPYECVGWSEIDKYAIMAHNAVFPEIADRNLGDMTKIDWSKVPDFDLLFYSTPCTDFSNAGKQAGGEEGSGTRSSILWYTRNAIIEKRPKYLVMENVKALTSEKFRPLFLKWCDELTGYGYTNFSQVLNAKDYGIPQNRERIFVVSILGDAWFTFPQPVELKLRLKDLLEDKVDEKYYLDQEKVDRFISQLPDKDLRELEDGR